MADLSQGASQVGISEEEKDKLVAEVVRCVLFKTHQSSGCPIKRGDLTQLITRNYRQRSLPAFIVNEARSKLASIFGYDLREIQRTRASSATQPQASRPSTGEQKSYIVVSKLQDDIYEKYVENRENAHITGFVFVVVSLVHLAGGRISSEDLWHHLMRLGLDENNEKHPIFGNMKHALESLVQQRYLQKVKAGTEGNALIYELAERALDQPFFEKHKNCIEQMADNGAPDPN
ncbi:melanoma-associated antigen G1-like protein isoform X2 [Wolffia australiana]